MHVFRVVASYVSISHFSASLNPSIAKRRTILSHSFSVDIHLWNVMSILFISVRESFLEVQRCNCRKFTQSDRHEDSIIHRLNVCSMSEKKLFGGSISCFIPRDFDDVRYVVISVFLVTKIVSPR